jgi:pyruvate kinase
LQEIYKSLTEEQLFSSSAETAIGEYPVESVKMMNNTIKCIERSPLYTRKSINI